MMRFLIIFIFAISLNAEIVVSAIGYGKNFADAKKSSLVELGRTIISNVNSEYTKLEKVQNGVATKDIKNIIEIKSNVVLQGVEYQNLQKSDGYFKVKAILNRSALNKSIKFLKKKISISGSKLSKNDLKEKLKIISILKPLITYSNTSDRFVEKKELEFLSYLNQAQIEFHTIPKGAVIEIAGKKFSSFQPIFLSKGKYYWNVSKNGYFIESGYLKVSNGAKFIKTVLLVPESERKTIFLDVANKNLKNHFQNSFVRYGISTSSNPNSKLKLKVKVYKNFVTEIDGLKLFNFTVEAKLYKNGKLQKVKKAKMRNKTKRYFQTKQSKIAKALVKNILK